MIFMSKEQYQRPAVIHKGQVKGRKFRLKRKETEIVLVA